MIAGNTQMNPTMWKRCGDSGMCVCVPLMFIYSHASHLPSVQISLSVAFVVSSSHQREHCQCIPHSRCGGEPAWTFSALCFIWRYKVSITWYLPPFLANIRVSSLYLPRMIQALFRVNLAAELQNMQYLIPYLYVFSSSAKLQYKRNLGRRAIQF